MTTIQDSGRTGLAYYAIPQSGVMDSDSAQLANTLVGNPADAAVIECNLAGPTIEFHEATTIALTGCDMNWLINGQTTERNKTIQIHQGSILKGGFGREGLRAYIAIKGEIIGQKHFDSFATYSYAKMGYNFGQPIRENHILEWKTSNNPIISISLRDKKNESPIQLIPGPEFNLLTTEAKSAMTTETFVISSESNRMGARLHGPKLQATGYLNDSVAMLPGLIQLTPAGQMIVCLQDGQTTGGYPRIAFIKPKELSRFNQLGLNQKISFQLEL